MFASHPLLPVCSEAVLQEFQSHVPGTTRIPGGTPNNIVTFANPSAVWAHFHASKVSHAVVGAIDLRWQTHAITVFMTRVSEFGCSGHTIAQK